jgi:hypothetical protein
MTNSFTNINCKIPKNVKEVLKKQSDKERVSMSVIVQDILMVGLLMRVSHKEKVINDFEKIQDSDKKSIGFMEY